ncbi:hypothetical protein AB0C98_11005 [Streptomyces sp. NPDC048558]|uniref:hypothetical protein n=1 Tax=Streptomyces sp. NPDC048558 TaxID=3155759 RepID=UPI0033E901C2
MLLLAEVEREVAVWVGGVEGDCPWPLGRVHDVCGGFAGHGGGPLAAYADFPGDALGADGEGDVPQPVPERTAVGGRGDVDGGLEAGLLVGVVTLVLVGAESGRRGVRERQPELLLGVAFA